MDSNIGKVIILKMSYSYYVFETINCLIIQSSVPPPPPMPPPPDLCDPSEVRPFMDPYGRAKTVRIGKWRWPPLSDGTSNGVPGEMNGFPTHQSFLQFKMSKQQNQRHKQSQVCLNGQMQ